MFPVDLRRTNLKLVHKGELNMKKNKNIIVLGIYFVALLILIFSSLFTPTEKYFVALLLLISFPVVYKKNKTCKKKRLTEIIRLIKKNIEKLFLNNAF